MLYSFVVPLFVVTVANYATAYPSKNFTTTSPAKGPSTSIPPTPQAYKQDCHHKDCGWLECPKTEPRCQQNCSYNQNCGVFCEKKRDFCEQTCENSGTCKLYCNGRECTQTCKNTTDCVQLAGRKARWKPQNLLCNAKKCEQVCNGDCKAKCETTDVCIQKLRIHKKYNSKSSYAECKSETMCRQHCVTQACIFYCDAPECHLTTRDRAVIGFMLSERVENVTLNCDWIPVPEWQNWRNATARKSGFRLCTRTPKPTDNFPAENHIPAPPNPYRVYVPTRITAYYNGQLSPYLMESDPNAPTPAKPLSFYRTSSTTPQPRRRVAIVPSNSGVTRARRLSQHGKNKIKKHREKSVILFLAVTVWKALSLIFPIA